MISSIVGRQGAGGDPRELRLGHHQALADTLAQLAGRHAREGDQQQLVERACPRRRSAPPARRSCSVLPVPALASSTVTPLGSGPRRSNGWASRLPCGSLIRRPPPRAPAVAARSRCASSPSCSKSRSAEGQAVLRLLLLALDQAVVVPTGAPPPHRRRDGILARLQRRLGVGVGGGAGQRQRCAQALGAQLGQPTELGQRGRAARLGTATELRYASRPAPGSGVRRDRSSPPRTAISGCAALQRQQPHPGGQPVARIEP